MPQPDDAPGLFTERQVEGWRAVTTAVHSEVVQSSRSLPIPGRSHRFKGTLIANFGFDRASANMQIGKGRQPCK